MQRGRRDWTLYLTALHNLRRSGLTERRFLVHFVRQEVINRETGIDAVGSYGGGIIHIADCLCQRMAIEVLAHEYTHHLAPHEPGHGPRFWRLYGRVFQVIFGDD